MFDLSRLRAGSRVYWGVCLGLCVCSFLFGAGQVSAVPGSRSIRPAAGLASFVVRVLVDSPEIQAAEAAVDAAMARQRGAGLPLYNPEWSSRPNCCGGVAVRISNTWRASVRP